MRIIIIGASGLVGSNLLSYFQRNGQDCVGTFNTHPHSGLIHLDINDASEIKATLGRVQPEIIISTAALSHVDYCEECPQESWKQNITAYQILLDAIKSINPDIKLVFFSSDYIFDGTTGPYSENAQPNPINEYGKEKLIAEKMISEQLKHYLILRTTVIYGLEYQNKNFAVRLILENKKGNNVKVPVDQIGTPTYVEDLAAAVYLLLTKSANGIFNVSGPELISRYEFAMRICKIFNLNKQKVVPVSTLELKQNAKRGLKLGLEIRKLDTFLQKKTMLPIEIGLNKMKKQMGFA